MKRRTIPIQFPQTELGAEVAAVFNLSAERTGDGARAVVEAGARAADQAEAEAKQVDAFPDLYTPRRTPLHWSFTPSAEHNPEPLNHYTQRRD